MSAIGPDHLTSEDVARMSADMERDVAQLFGHGPKGRFTPGNKCAKGRRAPSFSNLQQAIRRQLGPRACRAIARKLVRIARGTDTEASAVAAVAAAELLIRTLAPAPSQPSNQGGDRPGPGVKT